MEPGKGSYERPGSGKSKVKTKYTSCTLFVGNISYRIREDELAEFFSFEFGPVLSAEIVKDHRRGWSRGIGFITFHSVESVEKALAASSDQLILDGRTLRVNAATVPKRQQTSKISAENQVKCVVEENRSVNDAKSPIQVQSVVEENRSVNDSKSPIQRVLNDDVLFLVLCYLSLKERIMIERVCRQWHRVARRWWRSVTVLSFDGVFVSFKGKHAALTDFIFGSILARGCRELRVLDLSASTSQLTDYSLHLIGMYCNKLTCLNISRVAVTPQSLKMLTQHCVGLKTLIIRGCRSVGEKSLWWALHHCRELEKLDVSQNRRLNGQCFYMAVPTLTTVLLRDCDFMTDDGISLLAKNTCNLRSLNISKCGQLSGKCLHILAKIRSFADVEYIEEETMAKGMQYIPWHLDRLDQSALPLNQQYLPIAAGKGVDLYIVDSGINFAHDEFENRAKYSGYDPADDYNQENRQGTDCNGHGTHVASLAAGKTLGVAKNARVYSVRVLDCANRGPWSVVLQGLDHVSRVVAERGRPAVLSLSLGGSYFRTVNDVIQEMHSEGIFSASAAGNDFGDACLNSPASSSYTLTVGGSSRSDDIYFATNYGQCVDIFAPGSVITGADHRCNTCLKELSGTSMATPMVSGVAAILLSFEPLLKPDALRNKLLASSVNDVITFSRIPSSFRSSTANRLLQIAGHCGGVFTAPVVIQSPNYPQNYPHNLQTAPCQWTILSFTGGRVECNFTDFDTEANYDVVTVCDGQFCCPTSVLSTVSGNPQATLTFTSISSSLTVHMVSDGIVNRRGFAMSCSIQGSGPSPTSPPPLTTPPLATSVPTTLFLTTTPVPPLTTPPVTTPLLTTSPVTTPPLITPPTPATEVDIPDSINESCQLVPLVLADLIEETSNVLQELVNQSLSGALESKILGRLQQYPSSGCAELVKAGLRTSGFYWIRSANGSSVHVYCDLTTTFSQIGLGYMMVASLNMTQQSQFCPSSLRDFNNSCGKRLCGRGSSAPGCSSVFYSTFGVPYNRVCGSIIGYQFSSPNAFFAHQYDPSLTIEDTYLDGVSLTYGSLPRIHIWSFAAAISETAIENSICPCTNSMNFLPESSVPSFVQQDYFCDTGDHESGAKQLQCEYPLWDGIGCSDGSTCCEHQHHRSWFCANLKEKVTEDIEMRVCGNEDTTNEDTPLESVYLYIQ